ncbi:unnamed protein product, partial [Candidula unifasciata]
KMEIVTLVLGFLVVLAIFLWFQRHDSRYPPCPVRPLPLFGHLLYMDKNPRPQFKKWRKKCGDIYSIYMGQHLTVVVNGFDLVKETLVKHGDVTIDRPEVFFDAVRLAFSSGAVWKEQRLVTSSIMRTLGMVNKNILAERVTEGVAMTIDNLVSLKGNPTDLSDILILNLVNIICAITLGHKFNIDDEEFINGCNMYRANILKGGASNLANYFKFWSYLPGDLFGAKVIEEGSRYFMTKFVVPFIRQKGYDEYDESNLDNFIARYVYEWKKKQASGEPTTLSDNNLKKLVYDLLGGGLETTSTNLLWFILILLHYPQLQDRIYNEIDREIGVERMPKVSDKDQLPFLNAFILESQRSTSIVPLNLPRISRANFTIGGYLIPKGAQIVPSLDSILFEKKIWGKDANVFKPERFLDENGQVKCPEQCVPFSMGRRACPGSHIAQMEMFLFLASMVQRFKFLPDESAPLPSLDPHKAAFGLTAIPHQYKVRVVDRKAE